jgi:DNA/RNA-binding domain of Phe-tRNA-synthetase-like protein
MNAISSGAAQPAPRSRKRNERMNEAEAELQQEPDDEVVLHDDEGQRCVFVDGDDEGDLTTPDKTMTPDPVKQRARKTLLQEVRRSRTSVSWL